MGVSNTSDLVRAASLEIENAVCMFQREFVEYRVRDRSVSCSNARLVLKSNVVFVEYSWYPMGKYHITIGLLDEFGEIPKRVLTAIGDQFNTHYSVDIFGRMENAKICYSLVWRSDIVKATESLMANARSFLNGDWRDRVALEQVVRPGFKKAN